MEENLEKQFGEELLHWEIPEYERHERTKTWYIMAVIVAVALLTYAIWDHNYLFALIIVMFLVISIVTNSKDPENIDIVLTTDGIGIGDRFYSYDVFHSFSVIYKPVENLKMLYLEFGSKIRPRASIPLMNINPITVREIFLEHVPEDLERTDEPNTDYFSKKLKI
ncbi:MAG: hypothetical protein V1865_01110 [bacterium]